MDKYIVRNFIEAINNFDGSDQARDLLKDHICYISEHKNEIDDTYPIAEMLHIASQKLKVFGYDEMNKFKDIEVSDTLNIVDDAIKNYHRSTTSSENENIILDGLQKNIIDQYQKLETRRIMVSAPTSFGKSYLLQEILFNNAQEYENVMIILPTIALLNENVNKYQALVKSGKLNYNIVSTNYEDLDLSSRNLFIFTPERALKFLGKYDLKINFFFFDEVYKIEERLDITKDNHSGEEVISGNDKRAAAFRTCLYLLAKCVKDYYIAGPFLDLENKKCVGLKRFLTNNFVKIFQVKFDPTLRITYDAWKIVDITENNSIIPEARSYKTRLEKQNQVGKLVRIKKFIDEHDLGKTIVYLNYPSKIVEILKTSDVFDLQPIKNKELEEFIAHLKTKYNVTMYGISSIEYWTLIKCLEFGIGIHHGKMPKYIQNEILRQFNKPDGLNYLFCTSTIIEGVNTVAKNVVMLSNSYGTGDIKKFAFKNIKGRAGRYYSNFIGNLFYCDADQKKLDDSEYMHLEFLNYGDTPLLPIDLDNTEKEDLSQNNHIEKVKREDKYNKELLPDDVFYQNRLFDRLEQEKILSKILSEANFNKLYELTQKVIGHGISFLSLVQEVLDLEEDLLLGDSFKNQPEDKQKEILAKYKYKLYWILREYEQEGFAGLMKYQMSIVKFKDELKQNMDDKYNTVFEQIRTTIEYDIPKYLSLYQSLFNHACKIKNKVFGNGALDDVIKFYEIGASNDFGRLLIERGFPSESAKIIESELKKTRIDFLNNNKVIQYIDNHLDIISRLDEYEKKLYTRIINLYRKEL